jgi:5'-nucleotidase
MRVPNDINLAEEVEDIDLVLGGHDHHYYTHLVNLIKIIKYFVYLLKIFKLIKGKR